MNYDKLMALEPTVYETFTNQLGQEVTVVEHPLKGCDAPVIAIFHNEKAAAYTEFWDTEDFCEGSDYNPVFSNGSIKCFFEHDYLNKQNK